MLHCLVLPRFLEALSTRRRQSRALSQRALDALTDQIRVEMNQGKRKVLCSEVQKILADDVPYLPMWFNDAVSAHRRSLGALDLPANGNYNFLSTLHVAGN